MCFILRWLRCAALKVLKVGRVRRSPVCGARPWNTLRHQKAQRVGSSAWSRGMSPVLEWKGFSVSACAPHCSCNPTSSLGRRPPAIPIGRWTPTRRTPSTSYHCGNALFLACRYRSNGPTKAAVQSVESYGAAASLRYDGRDDRIRNCLHFFKSHAAITLHMAWGVDWMLGLGALCDPSAMSIRPAAPYLKLPPAT
jgi:hypothetical protein